MNKDDIKYILELINDAISDKDWDKVDEAKEVLNVYLDDDDGLGE